MKKYILIFPGSNLSREHQASVSDLLRQAADMLDSPRSSSITSSRSTEPSRPSTSSSQLITSSRSTEPQPSRPSTSSSQFFTSSRSTEPQPSRPSTSSSQLINATRNLFLPYSKKSKGCAFGRKLTYTHQAICLLGPEQVR